MDVTVRSRRVEVGPGLRSVVEDKVRALSRFLDGMERAEVCFSEERNPRIAEKEMCEITMFGHGHVVRAKASAAEILVALDRVLDKLEHRMEKLKGRLVGRSHPRHPARQGGRPATNGWAAVDKDLEADGEPRIVKVKQFAIKPMTPEEAELQMHLLSHSFFFFTNAETGRAAVVYRRHDGHTGLIDAT